MHTTAFWLRFPSAYLDSFVDTSPTERQNGIAGLANVLRTVGALLLMCDPRDLGVAVTGDTPDERGLFEPDLFLYDNYPGGIGQSEPLYRMREQLLQRARELIAACPCEAGCPGCVGPPGEAGDRAKAMALRLAAGTAELAARTAEGSLVAAHASTEEEFVPGFDPRPSE